MLVLAGNKNDKDYQDVQDEEVLSYCKEANIEYMKCSAKENNNVQETFRYLV